MMRAIKLAVACVAVLVAFGGQVQAGILFAPSYNADVVFQDQLGGTTMPVAFDGASYWSSSGGGATGVRLAQYDASGNFISDFSPGLDFRSVFSDSSGDVFARAFSNNTIFQQTSPGTFTPFLALAGSLNAQSSVVLNGDESEYVALDNGIVNRWDLGGSSLSDVGLLGWGSVSGESVYPANRGIAAAGDYWLTYSDGILSAWDMSGARVDQTQLLGAGTSFDSEFSISYANNRVFIVDSAGGNWRGYDVGLSQVSAVPEPSSLAMFGIGACVAGIGASRRRRREKQQEATA